MTFKKPDRQPFNLLKSPSPNRFPALLQFSILGFILLFIFSSYLFPKTKPDQTATPVTSLETSTYPTVRNEIVIPSQLRDVDIKAKAAYVFDVKTQRALYTKNPDQALPLASITKLMTALVTYELVRDNEKITISDSAIKQDGDTGLLSGEKFSVSNLRDYALIVSSNDAAYALSASVGSLLGDRDPNAQFVRAMNIRASELGWTSFDFLNPTGLDVSDTQPGAIGSARDVSFLLEYLIENYPEVIEATQQAESLVYDESGAYHEAANTNKAIAEIPNLIGSKTGYTDLAGGNLTIAFDAAFDRPVIITVLGSTYNDRFTDILTLVEAIKKSFAEPN